ncbi:PD-(D/E)XK nuclease family protein [Aneurinibacillus aneurinilyticus]|nr:PD-(D/E)XK nuclease family protein [Aneurinibacillus aneurinilyticus]MED0705074.1 PD-(D/E)XK nuclease family protein [Aneurinibacillus aneurinilyticus]MED0721875.1 PD-(D/E)XK nuclease family protein [Aneurinibacillus aneurinilyticus]MED0731566.1 PD-(D/E)XK nuclease family protein [Aneurinibacillus aneurinilyticus]MED0741646.1 PD-(D/E)XK nuclease family protein [Aneurinibacillus aneurinilyticus]
MDINKMKALPYDELRALYRNFLHSQNISKATINTAYVDTFYLWRKGSKELFWNAVTATDFENEAKNALIKALSENSTGNVSSLVNGYLSHLRRFRLFLASDGTAEPSVLNQGKTANRAYTRKKKMDVDVPYPSIEQVEFYLVKWDGLENYHLQEDALNKLFFELCPKNTDVIDILLKASTLNDFYSTNIFSIYPVAKHICALDIDTRLKAGDVTLVGDIQYVTIGDIEKNFYSFATKYCSHHNPLDYPIYDSYVDEVLRYFRNRDSFSDFQDGDLKDYVNFKGILIDFRAFYGLDKFNLKQIDQYVWQLGKDYFPKNYGKKNRGDK